MNISLKTIQRFAILYSIVALCVTLFFSPSWDVAGGLVSGAIVGIGNFRLLAFSIASVFSGGRESGRWGILFALKLLPLITVTGLLILVVHVNPIAFVAGFFSIVFGIVCEGLRAAVKTEAQG